jgi:hypothetical protein
MDNETIKTHLLTATYGKFDFIDTIVPKEILQVAAPRIIIQYLVKELGIEKTDIQMSSLRSWLFNYRKKSSVKQIPFEENNNTTEQKFSFSNADKKEKKFDF